MAGLYAKALYYRTQEAVLFAEKEPEAAEGDVGIPLEEQQEILKQIENVIARNKIAITKETFILHPQKKGFLFPLLNFSITIFISIAIIFFLQLAFIQRRSADILPSQQDSVNTESVLSRLKKESQASLANKEKEIAEINNQLKTLGEEKTKLQDSMEKNIEEKKAELARQMENKIEEEKKRLQEQGIALVDIDAQMKKLREDETGKYNDLLASYRKDEDAKRKQAEDKLTNQINSINSSLQTAKTDMEKIKAEAAETEKQLNQKLKEQEEEQKKKTQELLNAEETIKKLSEQRANEQMINDQIDGFYNTIIINLSESNLEAAKSNIQKMKDYFNKPEIMTMPGIVEKREKNLFLINALDQMIISEQAKKNIDYASLNQKAEIVSTINTKVQEADELYKKNEKAKAKLLYEEALNLFPDIKDSYVKLLEFNETEKSNQFRDFVVIGDEAYKNKEYTKAVANYKSAVKLIPGSSSSLDTLMNNIVEAGFQLKGNTAEKDNEEKLAQQSIAQANALFGSKSYVDAIDKYLDVLSRYPRSSQVEAARSGIKQCFTSIAEIQNLSTTESGKRIAELESNVKNNQDIITRLNTLVRDQEAGLKANAQQLAESNAAIKTLNASLKEKEDALASRDKVVSGNNTSLTEKNNEIIRLQNVEKTLRDTISTLQNEKKTAEEKLAVLSAKTATANTAKPTASPDTRDKTKTANTGKSTAPPTLSDKTEIPAAALKDIEDYKALQDQIAFLRSQYSSYTQKEDAALKESGPVGYLSMRPILGEMLSSGLVADMLPDLYNRLKAYDDALVEDALKAGNDQAIESVLEIIDGFYALEKNQGKTEYWKAQKQLYKDDDLFLEILDELQASLK